MGTVGRQDRRLTPRWTHVRASARSPLARSSRCSRRPRSSPAATTPTAPIRPSGEREHAEPARPLARRPAGPAHVDRVRCGVRSTGSWPPDETSAAVCPAVPPRGSRATSCAVPSSTASGTACTPGGPPAPRPTSSARVGRGHRDGRRPPRRAAVDTTGDLDLLRPPCAGRPRSSPPARAASERAELAAAARSVAEGMAAATRRFRVCRCPPGSARRTRRPALPARQPADGGPEKTLPTTPG